MVDSTKKQSNVDQFAKRQKELKDKGGGFVNRYASSGNEDDDAKKTFAGKYSPSKSPITSNEEDTNSSGGGENLKNSSNTAKEKKFTEQSSIRRKIQKEGFADATKKSRLDCIFLVRGKDGTRDAWHYVLVDKNKKEMFLAKSRTGSIDVSQYGKILRSGWGKDPPQDVIRGIEEEFGI